MSAISKGRRLETMHVEVFDDPERFSRLAGPWLGSNPFTTNVIGVQLSRVLCGGQSPGPDDVWIVASDEARVVGAAMHTPPFPIFLPGLDDGVAATMAQALVEMGRKLSGVNGERSAVGEFSEAWCQSTGDGAVVHRATRMYRLERLALPTGVQGTTRCAQAADIGILARWLAAFVAETEGEEGIDAEAIASRRVLAGELWLWETGGEPVSLAAITAPAAGVARVGPVYTPPPLRRHGYGSAVTAHVSSVAGDTGAEHVVLYTDLANPTSNAIYQAIGYVPDHDAEERRFIDRRHRPRRRRLHRV